MSFLDVVLLGVALSMDAFAISVTNGMIYRKSTFDTAVKCGFCFGFFQFLMPVAGFFAGSLFYVHIKKIDHWLALILLGFLGIKMIIEAVKERKAEKNESDTASSENSGEKNGAVPFVPLLIQGIATSIDALAVGISLSAFGGNIFSDSAIIGCTTFILSFAAAFIGKKSGDLLKDKAQLLGGIILTGMGLKIFIEHMFSGS